MRCYPADLPEAFELDRVLDRLAGHCLSALGAEHARELPVLSERSEIERRLDEGAEWMALLDADHAFPDQEFPDVRAEIATLDLDEAVLEADQLHRVRRLLAAYNAGARFLHEQRETYPTLAAITADRPADKEMVRLLDGVLDEEGRVRSNASPELVRIRKEMDAQQRELQRLFRHVLGRLRQQGLLAETEESVRGGRRVLALKAEHKRKVSGIVHDESDSGRTAFLEPQETVAPNNRLAELERAERREIRRILRELTRELAPRRADLAGMIERLAWLDLCRAKGRLGRELNAARPRVEDAPGLVLRHAFHPLLLLYHRAQDKETVPLDLELDGGTRILVVSGPNAGGKSVCLKTAGLLQLMVQAGLPVPVDGAKSRFGLFAEIFGDIGDAQSLGDELSTYSARLHRMRHFLEHAGKRTLFLIDEFGSGTDPSLGGAVAEAILDGLRRTGAFGVVTTHYANLKVYAERTPGLDNGSMAFDEERLEPFYRLETGKPGSSYTFEIARKIRLPAGVIRHAESLVDDENLAFEQLLSKVQGEEQDLARRALAVVQREQELERKIRDYEAAEKRLEKERAQARLKDTEREASALAAYERQFAELLEQLKDAEKREALSAEAVARAGRKARAETERIRGAAKKLKKALHYAEEPEGAIEPGAPVKLVDGGQVGEVIERRGRKAVVAFGQLRSTVKVDDLVRVSKKPPPPLARKPAREGLRPKADPDTPFSRELDLRGQTREEAMAAVDAYLNEAILRGVLSVRIVHGKGTGALRRAVRDVARQYPGIGATRSELPELGGDGVTVVEFG